MLMFEGNEADLTFEHKETRDDAVAFVEHRVVVVFGRDGDGLTMDLDPQKIEELRAWLDAID